MSKENDKEKKPGNDKASNASSERGAKRVGVFVCNCGINIAGVVNCPAVAEYAKSLDGVAHTETHLSYCTEAGAVAIQEAIEEHGLTSVVMAACTPKTHEPVFQSVLDAAALPKRMLEFVNLREQDSFVHMHDKDAATRKAKDLVAGAVARAKELEDIPTEIVDVTRKALVIGGGVAGLQAALDLAKMEYDVTVVESSPTTGGKMAKLDRTFPTDDCSI